LFSVGGLGISVSAITDSANPLLILILVTTVNSLYILTVAEAYVRDKFFLTQATKAHMKRGGITPLILNLGTTWM
jgi:hypothetical protein